jgi:hypothetical protein
MPRVEIPIVIDPRLIDQVVAFTNEVAAVAHDLFVDGHTDAASRLRDALDRLDADPEGR